MKKRQMILILFCFIIGCMVFTACRKKDNDKQESTGDVTITPTVTPTQSAEDTAETDDEPGTRETDEETGTEADYISDSEAIKYIQDIIGERGYYFELLDDHLNIGDSTYYVYQISDSAGVIEPNVMADKASGELLCYYSDGSTAPFSEYPLYTEQGKDGENENSNENEFTQEDALAQLSEISAKDLELPAELTKYTIIYDKWTTNIKSVECYGINAYSKAGDKMTNIGRFYVATDGSVMYRFDSMLDNFVEIKAE